MTNEFDKKVKQIIADVLRHEVQSIKEAQALLRRLHTEILAELAKGGSDFTVSYLNQLLRAVDGRIENFQREIEAAFKGNLQEMIDLAKRTVDEPIDSLKLGIRAFGISSQTAQVAAQYQVGMIAGIGSDLEQRINSILRRTALAGKTVNEAIREIGKRISKGPFKTAMVRAETLVRTEVLRIHSIATQSRLLEQREAARRIGYTVRKRWVATIDTRTRATHRVAALQEPIELEEFFIVGADHLLYPRDPNGSAEETINCRCVEAPVVEKLAA